jgi:hypothetical protein
MRRRIMLVVPVILATVLAVASARAPASPAPAGVNLAPAAVPTGAAFGVVLSNGTLTAFDVTNPGAADPPVAVTGLVAGDVLVGIDFRPQNGFLYGLGYNGVAGTAQLYHVSHRTGASTPIGSPFSFVAADGTTPAPVVGTNFGVDVNPTVDRIRVVNDAGQSFRVNPNTGLPIDANLLATGIQMDGPINGATTTVDAAAYTNNQQNATVTTLYTLSAGTNQLFIQNPPNNGTQTTPVNITMNGSALDFAAADGFDILPGVNVTTGNAVASGPGLAALTVGGNTGLYTVDLTTGAAALVGPLGIATPVQGFAARGAVAPGGLPAVALGADSTQLVRFDTSAPATPVSVTITGLVAGDVLVGIDWRPQTGQLLALGVNAAADTATAYTVDPQTGAVTAIGTAGQIAFVDGGGSPVDLPPATAGYGFDINPTVDRIRVVTNTGLNFRVNPITGAPIDADLSLIGIQTDASVSGAVGVAAAAYTNSFGQSLGGGGATTLYTLDPTSNRLFIQNPPNNGTQTGGLTVTANGTAVDFTETNGFDIPAETKVSTSNSAATGRSFAVLLVGGSAQLYRIELSTAAATVVGQVGSGLAVAGLAVGDGAAEPPPPPPPPPPPGFQALSPVRIFDTRPGVPDGLRPVAKTKIGGATELRVKLTDLAGLVPVSGVGAVSLNVTVTEPDGNGFVTVYPCESRPLASSVNFTTGRTVANAVIAPVSPTGEVCFYSFAATHLLADINGYFPAGSAFSAVSPTRVFDTRPGAPDGVRVVDERKVGNGYELKVQLTDLPGLVPATGVGAVSLNVTATEADSDGFVTVYRCDSRPLVSSLNYVAGRDVANAVIAPVSPSGEACFFSFVPTHLLADVNGYFPTGAGFVPVPPERLFDTRVLGAAKVGGAYEFFAPVADPADGVIAVSLNVTVTEPDGDGFVTVYPCDSRPLASNVNYVAGQTVPNAVIAPVSPDGEVCFYSFVPTHLLADINGFFPSN